MKTFLEIPIGRLTDDELVEYTRKQLKMGIGKALMFVAIFILFVFGCIPQLYKFVELQLESGIGEPWASAMSSSLFVGAFVGFFLAIYFQAAVTVLFLLLGKNLVQRRDRLLVKYYDMVRERHQTNLESEQRRA